MDGVTDISKISTASQYDSFKNHTDTSTSITVSGSVSAFGSTSFTSTISLDRTGAIGEVYYSETSDPDQLKVFTGYNKTSTGSSGGGMDVYFFITYTTTTATVTLFVVNQTAGSVTLTGETFTFRFVLFLAPI